MAFNQNLDQIVSDVKSVKPNEIWKKVDSSVLSLRNTVNASPLTLKNLKSGQKFKFKKYGDLCVFSRYAEGIVYYRNLKKNKNFETTETDLIIILQ